MPRPQRSASTVPKDVILSVRGLSIDYFTQRGPVHAVRDVSFDLKRGETLAIIGESGSGKTTLAVALIRLSPRSARIRQGQILFNGEREVLDIATLDDDELRRFRWNDCAMVFQAALNSFNPVLTIWDHFLDTARAHRSTGRAEVRARADELLGLVNLDAERVLPAYPHELSGGMKQRVCIAIAISMKPLLIIADEPTSALDVVVQRQVMETLRRVQSELGASVILIGHDMGLMAQAVDRLGVMYAGTLAELCDVRAIFSDPLHPYRQLLIASLPSLDKKGVFQGIPGLPPSLLARPVGCSFTPRCPYAMPICSTDDPALREVRPDHWVACHLYDDGLPAREVRAGTKSTPTVTVSGPSATGAANGAIGQETTS